MKKTIRLAAACLTALAIASTAYMLVSDPTLLWHFVAWTTASMLAAYLHKKLND